MAYLAAIIVIGGLAIMYRIEEAQDRARDRRIWAEINNK
jgi:hypothetical protein